MTPTRNWSGLLDGLLLAMLALLAFGPALGNGWIWDDPDYVTNNPLLRDGAGLRAIWLDPSQSPQWYPLVFTSFWVEHQLYGLQPFGYHLVNLLLHSLAAILLWRLLLRLRLPGAWLAAALFAVHPVMTESVAWVTERKNVLSAVLYLGAAHAFLAYLREVARPEERFTLGGPLEERPRDPWRAAGSVCGALLLFAAALFSKTVTASLPAALLVILWWKRVRLLDWRKLAPLAVMLAMGAVMGLFTAHQELNKVRAVGADWDLDFLERTLVAGRAVWFYLQKLLLPVDLVFIYPRWEIDAAAWWQHLFPLAALALVVALWVLRGRLGRGPLAAALLFGGTLFPALGYLNVYPHRFSWVADHFQYHASMAVLALLAALAARLPGLRAAAPPGTATAPDSATASSAPDWAPLPAALGPVAGRWPRNALLIAGLPLLALAALSFEQTGIYRDAFTLWKDTLARNPKAWIAANNLGYEVQERDPAEAERYYRLALEIEPRNERAHHNLGMLLLRRAEMDDAEFHQHEAIRIDPDYFLAWMALGEICLRRERYQESAAYYQTSIEKARITRFPDLEPIPNQYGMLAVALSLDGRRQEAEQAFREELRLYPGNTAARANFGRLLAESGRTEAAVRELQAVLQAEPGTRSALLTLAWIRAAHADERQRRPQAALRFAQTACGSPDPMCLDALAAALASAGRYEEALQAARQAADMAARAGLEELAAEIAERLRLYQRGEPFRSPTGLPGA